MASVSHYKVTHGLAFEVIRQFSDKRKDALVAIDIMCAKYGARKGRFMSWGSKVEGLWFDARPDKAWRPAKAKGCHGYWVPAKTNKIGRLIAEELKVFSLPQDEELAVALGCPPFFTDFEDGGQYCASVSVNERGGVFYLESAKYAPPDMQKFGEGMVKIERGEYYTAIDAKPKTATGA